MSEDENKSDVLIVGAGPTGLYAALLLSHMGCSVCIIDKKKPNSSNQNPTYLWSPRSLQLFQAFDLVNPLLEHGFRHWGLDTYTNKGNGNTAVTASRHKHSVWENDATEFSWSLSCESDQVCRVLSDALAQRKGVHVRYQHELIDMEDCEENDTCLATILPTHTTVGNGTKGRSNSNNKHHHNEDDLPSQAPYYWKSRIVLGADGTHSFVRQKLGIAYERRKSSSVFYTIEATVTTNFPAARKMAVVNKGPNSLFYIGHRDNRAYISFEHKPKWSQLTIDDDVPLILAQRHVKSIMEPYQIEFKPLSYRRWAATERTSEEFSVNRRYFLAGGAAQSICPEGILTSDLGLEQVNNLCWKLFLCLKHRGSPELLDTYDQECRSKLSDTREASHALIHLFSQNIPTNGLGLNSTPSRELIYLLNRTKHGFIGEAPYHANILNIDTASTLSIISSEHAHDTIQAVTASFTKRAQNKIILGAPGTLAPNSKLKPYTLFTLLVNAKETATPPGSIANGTKPSLTSNNLNGSKTSITNATTTTSTGAAGTATATTTTEKDDRPPRTSSRRWTRTRSNSAGGSSSATAASWLLSPIIKRNNTSSHTSSSSNGTSTTSTTTTAAAASSTTSLTTAERWRKIRTNNYSILDRMSQTASTSAFRIVVFCQSLTDPENLATLQRFRRHLEEPHSFMQRYEKLHSNHPLLSSSWMFEEPTNKRSSALSLSSISHRSSISSNHNNRFMFNSPPTSPVSTIRTSLDQPRSTSSFDFVRPSCDTAFTNTSMGTTPPSLFSFLYITSSSRTEIGKFLSDTKPAVVHAAFPLGLDKVYLDHDQQAHTLYNIRHNPSVVVIRPDGYIGACVRLQHDFDFEKLDAYFDAFLRPPIDLTSAAAMAADYYDL
ncbi:FAD binding domain-containing protein [Phascolomyces articulosus]|uniref:FAD binding domain-containing protein n=1 Tax=Phascolomyces articulosus TaxID=60185 RepID=A0AAD5K9M5_9FUNG|nr:FAD binding domain-containing protein [Phascolomyces articulosus]